MEAKKPSINFKVRIPGDLYVALCKSASSEDRTLANYVRLAIKERVGKKTKR